MTHSIDALRVKLMAGAAGAALLAVTPLHAQDAPSAEEQGAEEIIVTGFRASVEHSIEAKRTANQNVEIVSAEDIAGLPDVSIADALARLPGVTSQRTGGQANALNIRGLSQDLVSSTLNGREQVSTSGSRSIEFEQYPSELISQAAVYKSPMASQIEGGVAGKVELKTARPLDNPDDFSGTINVRGSYNDRAKQSPDADEFGYRVSASLQAKFLDDTLGVAIGYSRLHQPNVATRFVGYDYNPNNPIDVNGDGQTEFPSFGYEAVQFGGTETRDGLLGVIQYEPSDDLRILIDGYYSKFESDVRRRGVRIEGMANIAAQDVSNAIIVDRTIVGGTMQSGSGLTATLVNQDESDQDELYTIGANVQKDIGRVTITADASYSRANSFFNNSGLNVDAFDPATGTRLRDTRGALVVNYQLNQLDLPNLAYNHDFTDPATNLFQGFYIVPQEDTDELWAFSGDLTFNVDGPFVKSLQFGGRYATRDARRTITSYNGFSIPAPVQLTPDQFTIGHFRGGFAANGFPSFIAADIDAVLDQYLGDDRVVGQEDGVAFTRDQSFTLKEDVIAGYAQLNFDGIVGALPFRGNLGLRVVNTDQSSTSSVPRVGGTGPSDRIFVTAGDTYTELLPSFNGVLSLSDNDQLRMSASRQLSRASFFDLRSTVSITFDGAGIPGGNGGNPFLRPFMANQFDLGYEHYFTGGAITVGAFYKDLETFIIGGATPGFDFRANGYGDLLDNAAPPASGAIKQDVGTFTQQVNGQGGYVWGFEAGYTQSFTMLPAPFDGLGVTMNYAFTKSNLDITSDRTGVAMSIPLPGLSKHVFNPTLFFDKNGIGARLSARYRTKYVAPQVGLTSNPTFNAAETVIDAQLSYEFQDGALEGLKLLAQANNLTDEPNRTYWGMPSQTSTLQYFGRQFFLGASYKF